MNKKLSLIVIIAFLCVQMFSLQHMAEHGFFKHRHNGNICDVYLACEHNKVSNIPAQNVSFNVTFVIAQLVYFSSIVQSQYRTYSGDARAPPANLLF